MFDLIAPSLLDTALEAWHSYSSPCALPVLATALIWALAALTPSGMGRWWGAVVLPLGFALGFVLAAWQPGFVYGLGSAWGLGLAAAVVGVGVWGVMDRLRGAWSGLGGLVGLSAGWFWSPCIGGDLGRWLMLTKMQGLSVDVLPGLLIYPLASLVPLLALGGAAALWGAKASGNATLLGRLGGVGLILLGLAMGLGRFNG
ncbi:MAG: hypothetical protein COX57_05985 [Alphaproteobacteria bacterium CG_4_10_14_0_2_um_filter_63_37]|nr:MAG: hypothetical protein AUJ55_06955 [Proteobacteria bacterium CG1_02_64_396]PJA24864.1 MAG: hypothetical protein COX57_05985 [Alphaproteobacteria bacterium CG_4_10_14_0_2_um_filter_63_37]